MNDEALFSLAALRSARDAAELGDAPAPDDEAPGAESDSEVDAATAGAAPSDEDSDNERRRSAPQPRQRSLASSGLPALAIRWRLVGRWEDAHESRLDHQDISKHICVVHAAASRAE